MLTSLILCIFIEACTEEHFLVGPKHGGYRSCHGYRLDSVVGSRCSNRCIRFMVEPTQVNILGLGDLLNHLPSSSFVIARPGALEIPCGETDLLGSAARGMVTVSGLHLRHHRFVGLAKGKIGIVDPGGSHNQEPRFVSREVKCYPAWWPDIDSSRMQSRFFLICHVRAAWWRGSSTSKFRSRGLFSRSRRC